MKVLIQNTKRPENKRIIVEKILEDGLEYVQNEYGNFVVSGSQSVRIWIHRKNILPNEESLC